MSDAPRTGFRWSTRATFWAPIRSGDPRPRRNTIGVTRCHACGYQRADHGPHGECPEPLDERGV
jgi:hypothetical protein